MKSRLEEIEDIHKKKFKKTTNKWRVKNILLKNEWDYKKIKEKNRWKQEIMNIETNKIPVEQRNENKSWLF